MACNGISIGLFPQMQPLLSARPPVQVCSCSVPTLVRFPAPLHSLITGNTSLSIPGHAEILHNYLGFRTKFEQKKICARLREYACVLREYAPVLRVLRGPGNCENQKSEPKKPFLLRTAGSGYLITNSTPVSEQRRRVLWVRNLGFYC